MFDEIEQFLEERRKEFRGSRSRSPLHSSPPLDIRPVLREVHQNKKYDVRENDIAQLRALTKEPMERLLELEAKVEEQRAEIEKEKGWRKRVTKSLVHSLKVNTIASPTLRSLETGSKHRLGSDEAFKNMKDGSIYSSSSTLVHHNPLHGEEELSKDQVDRVIEDWKEASIENRSEIDRGREEEASIAKRNEEQECMRILWLSEWDHERKEMGKEREEWEEYFYEQFYAEKRKEAEKCDMERELKSLRVALAEAVEVKVDKEGDKESLWESEKEGLLLLNRKVEAEKALLEIEMGALRSLGAEWDSKTEVIASMDRELFSLRLAEVEWKRAHVPNSLTIALASLTLTLSP